MIKVYDFIISDLAKNWKEERGKVDNSVSTKEMEKIINKECKNIKSINTNTYTSHRHNNGDTDEVHIVFTVICE